MKAPLMAGVLSSWGRSGPSCRPRGPLAGTKCRSSPASGEMSHFRCSSTGRRWTARGGLIGGGQPLLADEPHHDVRLDEQLDDDFSVVICGGPAEMLVLDGELRIRRPFDEKCGGLRRLVDGPARVLEPRECRLKVEERETAALATIDKAPTGSSVIDPVDEPPCEVGELALAPSPSLHGRAR